MSKKLALIVVVELFLLIATFSGKTESNVQYYDYEVQVTETLCNPESVKIGAKVSGSYGLFSASVEGSYEKNSYQCIDAKVSKQRQGKRCQKGWTDVDSDCSIAVCNPKCDGGNVCVKPDECECNGRGSSCDSVACSNENNCYPGTCDPGTGRCVCNPGFSGSNCQTLMLRPKIHNCMATIFAGSSEKAVLTVPCTHEGQIAEPAWTNVSRPSKIQVTWRSNYENFVNLPTAQSAPHVGNAPAVLGVTKSSFRTSENRVEFKCSIQFGQNKNPLPSVDCDVGARWSEISSSPLVHKQQMWINISAEIGGEKFGSHKQNFKGSGFNSQAFTGLPVESQMLIKLDLEPPKHCLTNKITARDARNCDTFPIHLINDVTKNSRFLVHFYNWTDDDSHIENYHLDVYYMRAGGDKILRNVGDPVSSQDIGVESKSFTFDLRDPGVYALELTVRDKAGNQAQARKIILFSDKPAMNVDIKKPIRVVEPNITSSGQWATNINQLREGPGFLTVDWSGRFSSKSHYEPEWTYPVDPWNERGIDDRFGSLYGRRSIDQMDSTAGESIRYQLAYEVDTEGGRGLDYHYQQWTSFNSTVLKHLIPVRKIKDGDSLVIWFNANDEMGSGDGRIEPLIVHFDSTRPEIIDSSVKLQSPDEYTLSIHINTEDKESGIKEIRYSLRDKIAAFQITTIYNATAQPARREYPQNSGSSRRNKRSSEHSPCKPGDDTCYCIRAEQQCYNVLQTILIDHCDIAKYTGHTLQLSYTVVNLANLATPERTIELGRMTDIPCNPRTPLGAEARTGIIVGLIVGGIAFIGVIVIVVTVIRVKILHKPEPRIVKSIRSFSQRRRGHSTGNSLYMASNDIENAARKQPQDEPPPYKESGSRSEADSDVVGRVDRKDVRYGEQMGKGRFATVYRAEISRTGRKSVVVAAKKLRTGYQPDDVELMKNKIKFLKSVVPQHVNVVKYVGETDESNRGPPVLLLEFCELNLLDWLKGLNEINSTVETHLINIALNIARGMEHLHKNKIVHRRLAARNVLLNHGGGGGNQEIVAKIIGFGPASEKREKSSPLEWFAPETIESFDSDPVYNKRTDSWSFSIVMCEIFSKGSVPYPDVSRENLLNHLTSRKRMQSPDDMPSKLFEDVVQQCWHESPMKRPEFSAICETITSYRDTEEQPLYLSA